MNTEKINEYTIESLNNTDLVWDKNSKKTHTFSSKKDFSDFLGKEIFVNKVNISGCTSPDFIPEKLYKMTANEIYIFDIKTMPSIFKLPYAKENIIIENVDLSNTTSIWFSNKEQRNLSFNILNFNKKVKFSNLNMKGNLSFNGCFIPNVNFISNLSGKEVSFVACYGMMGVLDLSGFDSVYFDAVNLSKIEKIVLKNNVTHSDLINMGLGGFPIEKIFVKDKITGKQISMQKEVNLFESLTNGVANIFAPKVKMK